MNIDGKEAIDYIEENNIQGCIVECGVWNGDREVEFITRLDELNAERRHIYMYDTFEGMVQPTEKDYTLNDSVLYRLSVEETYINWKYHQLKDRNYWCYCSLENVI